MHPARLPQLVTCLPFPGRMVRALKTLLESFTPEPTGPAITDMHMARLSALTLLPLFVSSSLAQVSLYGQCGGVRRLSPSPRGSLVLKPL